MSRSIAGQRVRRPAHNTTTHIQTTYRDRRVVPGTSRPDRRAPDDLLLIAASAGEAVPARRERGLRGCSHGQTVAQVFAYPGNLGFAIVSSSVEQLLLGVLQLQFELSAFHARC